MRRIHKYLYLLAALLPATALAQGGMRPVETELAQDFLALELAGWRLPDPMTQCLEGLRLRHLEPGTYGSVEMAVDPILVDGPGPFARLVAIEPDPADRRRRIVRIQWLIPNGTGTRTIADRFTMAINDPARADETAGGAAAMLREPDRLVVRRECFGG